MKFLMIDNFDSFTYNLVDYFRQTKITMDVVRNNDDKLLNEDFVLSFHAIVISPGPSNPSNAGYSTEVLKRYHHQKPFFGVCLGMQIINEFFGGSTSKSDIPVHGKTATIQILEKNSLLLKQIPNPFMAARYHSLYCANVPKSLKITSIHHQMPMSVEHLTLPVFGVQFHPESFLTPDGLQIIKNFTEIVYERS
jgi:anthranilate synthase component 2